MSRIGIAAVVNADHTEMTNVVTPWLRLSLVTFRRKNAVSEATLITCGRNGVGFAVQFRAARSINLTER